MCLSVIATSPVLTALHTDMSLSAGALVLQGKSSCMPAAALDPAPGWTVVDCCAAPGNKTTHLAARMQVHDAGAAVGQDLAVGALFEQQVYDHLVVAPWRLGSICQHVMN